MTNNESSVTDPHDWDWDQRYRDSDAVWSGEVNGALVAEVNDIPPGRVIDVGCGEGADAIWLAKQGWQVTAVDVSATAVGRGRAMADATGSDVTWLAADILSSPPDVSPFDLVSLQYPAFPASSADQVCALLTSWVAEGGTLLVVGHERPADPSMVPFVHDDWVQPATVAGWLGDGWRIETYESRPRVGEHLHGSVHTHDVVLRARRRTS